MATKQRLVYGSTIEWSSDGTTFTNLPEAKALAVPETEQDYQDVTTLDSPNGFREYIPGLKDAGEISIECGYTSDAFETALGYQTNKTLVHFEVTLTPEPGVTGGDVFEFTAFVNPSLQSNEVGAPIGFTLNLRVSGAPTMTKGT